jgi:metal-sulfur cluster biosynthetic enzyme
MPSKTEVVAVLKQVYDPEIPVNIYDLGLVYAITAEERSIAIQMSLTSRHCPAAKEIPADMRARLADDLGVEPGEIRIDIVWEPAWSPARISLEGRRLLGMPEDALYVAGAQP